LVGQVIAIVVSALDSLHIAGNVQDFGSPGDIYVVSACIGNAGHWRLASAITGVAASVSPPSACRSDPGE
jgi:hypothetical protein